MASRAELINPALQTLAALDEAGFERLFNGSPVRRAGFDGLRRNLAVAMGNSGLPQYLSRLEEWSNSTNEALRHASLRALRKLRTKTMLTESRQSNRR